MLVLVPALALALATTTMLLCQFTGRSKASIWLAPGSTIYRPSVKGKRSHTHTAQAQLDKWTHTMICVRCCTGWPIYLGEINGPWEGFRKGGLACKFGRKDEKGGGGSSKRRWVSKRRCLVFSVPEAPTGWLHW